MKTMQILVQPAAKKCSSDSCNYTCPVFNMGFEGIKTFIEKFVKKKHKGKKHKAKVCWYGN